MNFYNKILYSKKLEFTNLGTQKKKKKIFTKEQKFDASNEAYIISRISKTTTQRILQPNNKQS